jgi:hypothetical protein
MQSVPANVCPLLKETTVVGILRIYQKLEPKCNILAYTVRFKERVTREPNFSSSQKRVSRDHSLSSSLKEKVSRDHSLNPSLKILVLCSPE